MLVIETNISYENGIKEFCDHQSRIVIVESWEDYINTYINQESVFYQGTMGGRNFSQISKVSDLEYDDFHLSCDIDNGFWITKKLAYKVQDEFELTHNIKQKEMKDMDNHWTFAEYGDEEWVHETFTSKATAISEGKKLFNGKDIVVGQLISNGLNYKIENKEVIESDYNKLIGENHKDERVDFVWDRVGEELI